MQSMQRAQPYAWIVAALVLTGCAGQKQPAQKLIDDVQMTVTAAAPEASKYVPAQLADVQAQLEALKASFDKKDYPAVIAGAPPVLTAAQGLAIAAAAKKDEVLKELGDQWTHFADTLPADVAAIQNRIDLLGRKASKKMAAGIDLEAAKAGLGDASALWSKAQAAFAAGNMDEAVSTAKSVKTRIDALATSLKLDAGAMVSQG